MCAAQQARDPHGNRARNERRPPRESALQGAVRLCASAGILSRNPRWRWGLGMHLRALPGTRRRAGLPSESKARREIPRSAQAALPSQLAQRALGAGLCSVAAAAATRSPAPPPQRLRAASVSRQSSADQPSSLSARFVPRNLHNRRPLPVRRDEVAKPSAASSGLASRCVVWQASALDVAVDISHSTSDIHTGRSLLLAGSPEFFVK